MQQKNGVRFEVYTCKVLGFLRKQTGRCYYHKTVSDFENSKSHISYPAYARLERLAHEDAEWYIY